MKWRGGRGGAFSPRWRAREVGCARTPAAARSLSGAIERGAGGEVVSTPAVQFAVLAGGGEMLIFSNSEK